MKLNERLQQAEEKAGRQTLTVEDGDQGGDPYRALKKRAQEALFVKLGPRLYDASLSEDDLQEIVSTELDLAIEDEAAPFSADERRDLVRQIREDILGYGPIHMFLEDPSVTEIMVNAEELIYIERDGKIEETDARFASRQHLRRVIDRIVAQVGRRIDESSPMVDARLPDGSRVNAVIPPLTSALILMADYLNGALVVEVIFSLPGIGQVALQQAVYDNDWPLLAGTVFVFIGIYVGFAFMADILYALIDPRIRYG